MNVPRTACCLPRRDATGAGSCCRSLGPYDARRESRPADLGVDRGRSRTGWSRTQPDGRGVREQPRSRRGHAVRDRPGDPAARKPARRRPHRSKGDQRPATTAGRRDAAGHPRDLPRGMPDGLHGPRRDLVRVTPELRSDMGSRPHRAGGRSHPAPDASGGSAPRSCARGRRRSRRAMGSHRGDGGRGSVSGRHDGQRVRPRPPRRRSDYGDHRNAETLRRLLVQ